MDEIPELKEEHIVQEEMHNEDQDPIAPEVIIQTDNPTTNSQSQKVFFLYAFETARLSFTLGYCVRYN